jgi:adenylate cyclase
LQIHSAMADLASIAFGAAYLYAEPRSPTTRALSIAFIANGFADPQWVYTTDGSIVAWRILVLNVFIAISGAAFAEWIWRVARTARASSRAKSWIWFCTRLIQCVMVLPVLSGLISPEGAYHFYVASDAQPLSGHLGALLLLSCVIVVTLAFVLAGGMLFLQPIDSAERIRALGLAAAIPFLSIGLFIPIVYGAICNLAGQLVFLFGALRYHAMQGQRGQFLARFLSPQVSEQVRAQGLLGALHQTQLEITVVCCDLRGFTAFSQVHPSQVVAEVLHDYYTAVSEVVARFGGTIKDFAGDGILILVGAPIPLLDHAKRGLELATAARQAALQSIGARGKPDAPLGVGFGVASGKITVGVIEAASRLEYMAIGPAVNLAARLCAAAGNGEIRVACETADLSGAALEACQPAALKGFGEAVPHFAVPA